MLQCFYLQTLLEVKNGMNTGQADGHRIIGGHLNSKDEHLME